MRCFSTAPNPRLCRGQHKAKQECRSFSNIGASSVSRFPGGTRFCPTIPIRRDWRGKNVSSSSPQLRTSAVRSSASTIRRFSASSSKSSSPAGKKSNPSSLSIRSSAPHSGMRKTSCSSHAVRTSTASASFPEKNSFSGRRNRSATAGSAAPAPSLPTGNSTPSSSSIPREPPRPEAKCWCSNCPISA